MNPSSGLQELILRTNAEQVANSFLVLIAIAFILGLYFYKRDKAKGYTHYAPNLLTSIGILGTFMGIVIGLIEFDPSDIDASIPLLLDGLKTAFITSLAGMAASISYKVLTTSVSAIQPPQFQGSGPSEVGPEDIYASMIQQNEGITQLRKAIAGDEDSSLVSQIKLLRSDHREHQIISERSEKQRGQQVELLQQIYTLSQEQVEKFSDFRAELKEQMQEFADTLSKSATEQVIDALRQVIVDFNNNLTEQFGENFKALDASVKKLVTWQDNYQQQLADMKQMFDLGVQSIEKTEKAVSNISESAHSIPETMNGLKTLLETTQHQLKELSNHLEAFKAMRDEAVAAVPTIREQVDMTVSSISDAATQASEHYRRLLDSSDAYIEAHDQMLHTHLDEFQNNFERVNANLTTTSDAVSNSATEITAQLKEGITDVNSNIRDMVESLVKGSNDLSRSLTDMGKATEQHAQDVQQQNNQIVEALGKQVSTMLEDVTAMQTQKMSESQQQLEQVLRQVIKKTGESVNEQMAALDSSMQSELERVIQHMGKALAQISGRFTEDYSKLTSSMQKIVESGPRGNY